MLAFNGLFELVIRARCTLAGARRPTHTGSRGGEMMILETLNEHSETDGQPLLT